MTDLPAMTLPAELVIPAWRNAFLASSDDDDRPALYRAVLVEWYAEGLRFVATDSYVIVASWAALDRENTQNLAPDHDEAPVGQVVAIAADKLMADFLKHRAVEVKAYYRALDGGDAAPEVDVTFSIGTIDEPNTAQQQLDLGEDRRRLIVSCDTERIALPLWHGAWPDWRTTLAEYKPSPRALVSVRRDLLRRIGQLDSFPYIDDQDWLRLTMANGGDLVMVDGLGRVPVEGAFVPRRAVEEQAEGEAA